MVTNGTGNGVAHPPKLKNPKLFRQQAYVNGKWINSASNRTIPVYNPATGELIGSVPDCGVEETKNAIKVAKEAFDSWRFTPPAERSKILRKWYNLMMDPDNTADLAKIMTVEQGKPTKEAAWEIAYAAGFFDVYANEALHIFGEVLPAPVNTTRIIASRQPVGVVGAITPWNFPSAMITRKAGAAIAAGCTVVLKPSEFTPYSAYALCVLAEEAGIPPGVFNVLTGDAKQIGAELTSSHDVKKITFTGSTAVGRLLMKQAADTVKRVSLELGGNAPFIVFDDADIDKAVEGAIANKYRNAGQTCVTANRIYVQKGVYDEFAKKFTEKVKALKVGNGLDDGTVIGPLINENAIIKVQRHIDDAKSKGANVVTGGQKFQPADNLTDQFYKPTVVTNVTTDMLVATEETFGPAAFLFKFETEAEVIAMANNTIFGLASYAYTADASRQWRLLDRLEYGMIGINAPSCSLPSAPFGGVKQSGLGREGSHLGLHDYLDVKTAHIGIRATL